MKENKKFTLTVEGLEEYKRRYDELINVERPKNQEMLAYARSQGDLSENADYSAAREEQSRIESEIKEIEYILANHEIIVNDGSGIISEGKKVTIKYTKDNLTMNLTIVGTLEADPFKDKISSESPLGKALMTHKVNDLITFTSETGIEQEVQILSVE